MLVVLRRPMVFSFYIFYIPINPECVVTFYLLLNRTLEFTAGLIIIIRIHPNTFRLPKGLICIVCFHPQSVTCFSSLRLLLLHLFR